jgi:hypothetical protein|tara:strand:- start:286 stop:1116 length:831 start_codon:yes stop_codon:yes gene_type:complete
MIKILRKTKNDMINENQPTKYFLIAFGEIVLVVIGILIALQVNNWQIERTNAKQEINILLQLKKEYADNLKEIEQKIQLRHAINTSIYTLINYSDEGVDGVSIDSIAKHVTRTRYNPTFDGPTGVTNDLLSSGKLYLLQNTELRNLLTNWSGTTQKVIEEEQFLVNHILPKYIDYIGRNYDARKMMAAPSDQDLYVGNMLINGEQPIKVDSSVIKGQTDVAEYSRFINDMIISNYQIELFNKHALANDQSYGLKAEIQKILALIQDGININRMQNY